MALTVLLCLNHTENAINSSVRIYRISWF